MVERLCGAIVILQQHRVCVLGFTGEKRGLHFQKLWEERKVGPPSLKALLGEFRSVRCV